MGANQLKILILFFGIIILNSCNHYYYVPNEGTLLTLDEKKDLQASIGLGSFLGSGGSLSTQVAYSPIKHLGLQSSYFRARASGYNEDGDGKASGIGYIANLAAGSYYFFPLKKDEEESSNELEAKAAQGGLLIDFYTGFESGEVSNNYSKQGRSQLHFNKVFIQGGLHWQGSIIGFDLVIKMGNLDFKNGSLNGAVGDNDLTELQEVELNDPYDFIESSWRLHIKRNYMKFFFTQTFLNSSKLQYVKFSDRSSHIGLIFDINNFFKKRRN